MFVRRLLLILFRPFRFAFRHKIIVFGSMLAIYLLVSLTIPGKAFLFRMNPRLFEANDRFIQSVGRYVINAFQGTLFTETPASVDEDTPVPPKAVQHYVVTAPKGLYIREQPSGDGEKIALMKLSTTVEYLDEKTEAKDVVWLKIRLDDGTSGWANAAWLSEVTDG